MDDPRTPIAHEKVNGVVGILLLVETIETCKNMCKFEKLTVDSKKRNKKYDIREIIQ